MTERRWIYQPIDPNGGAGGAAYHQIFNGSGFEAAELLAREAVQNSVDASTPEGNGARISFRKVALTGDAKADFHAAAGLDDLVERVDELGLPEDNVLREPEAPLYVLYAEDSETKGLSGDPTKPSSDLRKLLMEIGGSLKTDADENSGGSYGFGKAVWSASSRIATIFAYSRTTDADGQPLSVLMGCSYHRSHEFDGKATSGRGFFARAMPLEKGPDRYDPYTGEEADDMAERLGMEREEGHVGTTIAILDCTMEMSDLRKGIEKWWWPRMLRDGFRVELHDMGAGKEVPRPKKRKDIMPYWAAMEVVLGKSPERSGHASSKKLNTIGGRLLGTMGLVIADAEVEEDREEESVDEVNSIAMVRSPGMVVWHHSRNRFGLPPVAAVFVADEGVDGLLRSSEPPEHNQWDPKAGRLTEEDDNQIVRSILNNTWRTFRTFQKNAQPKDRSETGRIGEAERLLGKILGPSTRRPPPGPTKEETPISLVPKVMVGQDGDGLVARGTVTIAVKEDAEPQDLSVSFELRAVDESGGIKDAIVLRVIDRKDFTWNGRTLTGCLSLAPGENISLSVESDRYANDWTVNFQPIVRPTKASEEVG